MRLLTFFTAVALLLVTPAWAQNHPMPPPRPQLEKPVEKPKMMCLPIDQSVEFMMGLDYNFLFMADMRIDATTIARVGYFFNIKDNDMVMWVVRANNTACIIGQLNNLKINENTMRKFGLYASEKPRANES